VPVAPLNVIDPESAPVNSSVAPASIVAAYSWRASWRIDSFEACANRGVASNFAVAL
jgi:hypothetical protein